MRREWRRGHGGNRGRGRDRGAAADLRLPSRALAHGEHGAGLAHLVECQLVTIVERTALLLCKQSPRAASRTYASWVLTPRLHAKTARLHRQTALDAADGAVSKCLAVSAKQSRAAEIESAGRTLRARQIDRDVAFERAVTLEAPLRHAALRLRLPLGAGPSQSVSLTHLVAPRRAQVVHAPLEKEF